MTLRTRRLRKRKTTKKNKKYDLRIELKKLCGGFFMRKHRRSIWTNAPLSAATAVSCGILITGAAWLLLSLVLFYVMGDMKLIKAFAGAALVSGAYTGAFLYGKYRRRKGLFGGSLCGAIMYGTVSIVGLIILGTPADIKKLLLLTLSGAAGGVAGVNSKRPKKLMDQ